MFVNALTFGASAVILGRLAWGASVAGEETTARTSLLEETRLGLRAAAGMPVIRVVIAASAGTMLMAGLFNVAEPLFATVTLGTSDSGFALLVTVFGLGFIIGSLRGSEGGGPPLLRRRYLQGLFVIGIGFMAPERRPGCPSPLLTFTLAGFGNGLLLVHERLLIQAVVPEHLQGRVFAVSDTAVSWAFAIAFLAAGPLLTEIGVRATLVIAGGMSVVVAVLATWALRNQWRVPARRARCRG